MHVRMLERKLKNRARKTKTLFTWREGYPPLLFFSVSFTCEVGLPQEGGKSTCLLGLLFQEGHVFVYLSHVNARGRVTLLGGSSLG